MRHLCLAFLAAILATTPAVAQDGSELSTERTVEGANAFLNEFLARNEVYAIPFVNYPNRYGRSERKRWQDWRLVTYGTDLNQYENLTARAAVRGVVQRSHCVSEIQLADFHYRGTKGDYLDPDDVALPGGESVRAYPIDWSKISTFATDVIRNSMDAHHGFFIRPFGSEFLWMPLAFQTAEDARRVAFALEFLRAACVPKPTTGF